MSTSRVVGLLCLALIAFAVTQPAEARKKDAAEIAFNEKFGDEVRAVRRTRETTDDAQLAQRLFNEAQTGQYDEQLTTRIYEKAYEYGLRDKTGYRVANQALDKLAENESLDAFEIGDLRLSLWEKWYELEPKPSVHELNPEAFIDLCLSLSEAKVEAGDINAALKYLNRANRFASKHDSARKNDVRDTITHLVRMRKTMEEIAELEAVLDTDPTAAKKLAMIHLADLDDPATASLYAHQIEDGEFAANLLLAATDFAFATPESASDAGAFYYALATGGDTKDPVAMLIRSRVWLTEFLSRERDAFEEEELAERIATAKATVAEIDEALLKRGVGKKLRRKMESLVRGEGQIDRPEAVQAAIDKAVEWLYSQRRDDRHWEQDNPNHRNWGGYTALVVYALLMADEDPRVNGDLSRATHFMMNLEMKGTYALCFRIHAWEVMPKRERYRQTLVSDVQRLRRGVTKHGYWGYTMAGNDVKPATRLDTSTTLAGGLGLWIGEEVGGISPNKANWERVARGLIEYQLDDKGWCYNPATQQTASGAMTAGALALLYASRPHVNEATKVKVDEAIAKGMEWMDENFSATNHVNRGGWKNYYFAAVQHAGIFANRREFRKMDWYQSIEDHLIKTQSPNGAWGDVAETAFAVAFLCRGGVTYELSESENAEPVEADTDDAGNANADDEAPID